MNSILFVLLTNSAWAQTTTLRYEGELNGGSLSSSTLTGQQFQVTVRRPDNCGGDLITSWSSSSVTITNGQFAISPSFNTAALSQVMNPNNAFGASCTASADRQLVIRWLDGSTWETFRVSMADAPRSSLASEALNTSAIAGKPVEASLTCNTNEYLKYDGTKFICDPIAVIDIPVMDATKITSGTFSSSLIPSFSGDVTGGVNSTSVTKLLGRSLDTVTPGDGQVLTWNNTLSKWQPQTPSLNLPDITTGATTVSTGTSVPVITYDNKGRITGSSSVAVNDSTKLSLSGGALTGNLNLGGHDITNINSLAATSGGFRTLDLFDSSTNRITLRSPASTSSYSLTLPNAQGSNGQVLVNDGSGVLSWSNISGGGVDPGSYFISNRLTTNNYQASLSFTTEHGHNSGAGLYGLLIRPDASPVTSSTTQFRVQIRTPGSEDCPLWEETVSRDLSNLNGHFSIAINDPSDPSLVSNTLPYTWERIFSNAQNFTGLTSCASGSTYTPNPYDGRKIVVYFRENATDPWEALPAFMISDRAVDAKSLNGFRDTNFLKVDPASAYTPLSSTSTTTLVDIANKYYSQHLQDASTCTSNQKLHWSTVSDKWVCTNISGFVTSVGLNMPSGIFSVSPTNVTSTGTFSVSLSTQLQNRIFAAPTTASGTPSFRALDISDLPVGTTVGTVAAGNDSRFPASTCGTGNKMRWTGSTWICETDATGIQLWTQNASNIYYNTGNVGIGTTSPTFPLHILSGSNETAMTLQNSGTGGGYFSLLATSNLSGFGGGKFIIYDQANSQGRFTIVANGNNGINTTNPRAALDVAGAVVPAPSFNNSTATVDFIKGNIQHTALSCQSFNLNNLKDGGTYTFIVKGTTAATCFFNAFSDAGSTGLTVHAQGTLTSLAGSHTIFNFMVSGNDVYVTFANGM